MVSAINIMELYYQVIHGDPWNVVRWAWGNFSYDRERDFHVFALEFLFMDLLLHFLYIYLFLFSEFVLIHFLLSLTI